MEEDKGLTAPAPARLAISPQRLPSDTGSGRGRLSLNACRVELSMFGPERCHSTRGSLRSPAGSNAKSPGPQGPSGISHCSLLPHLSFCLWDSHVTTSTHLLACLS